MSILSLRHKKKMIIRNFQKDFKNASIIRRAILLDTIAEEVDPYEYQDVVEDCASNILKLSNELSSNETKMSIIEWLSSYINENLEDWVLESQLIAIKNVLLEEVNLLMVV